ncbi:histidine phosphatase family protein [Cutibacterium equinum]|uniref:Histidine phosphatase family protein n=1 Tax=Cutibacterium equinum TaxID=3016342 RepID=A0ABY7QVU9_9ACTN|nr:histidine phosphatase family protein [Cutibacterium equinum]WCC79191.1 histidine phosphatase family protein [Cutibacterium equinum]
MARLLLIRHGRTEANAKGVLAGRSDHPLDEVGVRDVRVLASHLSGLAPEFVATSPVARARQTAAILTEGAGWTCPVRVDDDVAECDYGTWAGRSLVSLSSEPGWRTVVDNPPEAVFPGGETMAEMFRRTAQAARRIAAEVGDGAAVVVSHGDPLRAIVADLMGLPHRLFHSLVISPASMTVLVQDAATWRVQTLNWRPDKPWGLGSSAGRHLGGDTQ